jgi:hypothetical protein
MGMPILMPKSFPDICHEVIRNPNVDMDLDQCMEWFTQAACQLLEEHRSQMSHDDRELRFKSIQ